MRTHTKRSFLPNYWTFIAFILSTVMMFGSCAKNDGALDGDGDITLTNLPGTIYYDWATEGILKVSLPDATGGAFIPDNAKLNSFDISRDGRERLTVTDESTLGSYPIRFTLSNMADNGIIDEFVYRSPGLNRYCKGYLSPDKSHILVTSNEQEDGITILTRTGELVTRIIDINGEPFDINETRLWLPGNSILITHKNLIIKLDPPYTSGSLVQTMNHDDWGDLQVNNAGNQMLVRIGNHIHTMDFAGGAPVKITESNFKEGKAIYSPDDRYILVGSNYRQTGPFGYVWDLKIIPNDGQTYQVDPVAPNSPGVSPVTWREDRIETAGGQVIWR